MKIDEHMKTELRARHEVWLRDPITQHLLEVCDSRMLRIAMANAENAMSPAVSDSVVRVTAGQAQTWNAVKTLVNNSDKLIEQLEKL
jgi:hypothetical protein